MWICPKCGREFKRTNQGHYCGNAPQTVTEYIESQAPEARAHLLELSEMIRRCVPGVKERIAWSMPFFEKGKCSVSFAACKSHVSLYLETEVLEVVKPQLSAFVIKNNALYLPYTKALPTSTIEHAVRQCFSIKQEE